MSITATPTPANTTPAKAADQTTFEQSLRCLWGALVHAGLRPLVTQQYELADGATALHAIEKRAVAGKLVLTTR
ncbi:MAG: zinc-binding dehydrogenase [Pseudonocardiaceae bacterium]